MHCSVPARLPVRAALNTGSFNTSVRASVLAALLALGAAPGHSANGTTEHAPTFASIASVAPMAGATDRLIIKYRQGEAPLPTVQADFALQVASNRQGVSTSHLRRMANGAHVFQFSRRISAAEARTLAQNMRAGDPNVEYAEPDMLLQSTQVAATPTDPMYNQQWALSHNMAGIRAPGAWSSSKGAGVVVAVIDSGVRPHADLKSNLLAGIDFVTDTKISNDGTGRDGDPADPGDGVAAGFCATGSAARKSSWHGTHVAGIVAAAGNAIGVTGVAPLAKILPVRAMGRCGGYTSDIADAITWSAGGAVTGIAANTKPARVINLSLGGTGACSATMQTAIQGARARGALIVVSAGNSNVQASQATPANCSGVVTVAATGMGGGKASYSNYGPVVTLAAPGGDSTGGILSTLNAGASVPTVDSYVSYMGTSMAAPMVSGVAALMLAAQPALTPDQLTSLLKSTATPFPAACSGCGSGIVNAAAAVAAARAITGSAVVTPPAANTGTATPTPLTSTVVDKEPNNTIATAQLLGTGAVQITGNLTVNDQDHYRLSLTAGKKLVAIVNPASGTAAGLGVFMADGRQVLMLAGAAGATRKVTVTNSGTVAVPLVLRVLHSSGTAGSYSMSVTQ
jgi:serine protease